MCLNPQQPAQGYNLDYMSNEDLGELIGSLTQASSVHSCSACSCLHVAGCDAAVEQPRACRAALLSSKSLR